MNVTARLKRTVGWKRTNDIIGHTPKFKITCRICESPMFMRHSTVGFREGMDAGINQIAYKCPVCDWFITFEVRDDPKYITKVGMEYRQGQKKLIPTDMWLEDDETGIIKEKLESLGYV